MLCRMQGFLGSPLGGDEGLASLSSVNGDMPGWQFIYEGSPLGYQHVRSLAALLLLEYSLHRQGLARGGTMTWDRAL